ncbi:MAG: hypothetical protein COA99_08680 [Moraxellaceae bacterium]|nr:MAG: hypothetical protein COA99_08680 [Moraxellaceae bacterium]
MLNKMKIIKQIKSTCSVLLASTLLFIGTPSISNAAPVEVYPPMVLEGADYEYLSNPSGDSANRYDVVIVGEGFTEGEDLDSFRTIVDNMISKGFQRAPFDEYGKYFRVHRIDVVSAERGTDAGPEEDTVDTAFDSYAVGSKVTFDWSSVRKIISGSGVSLDQQDLIIVIYNGIGQSYALPGEGVVVINLWGPTDWVFVHEIGHVVGGLSDEYINEDVMNCDTVIWGDDFDAGPNVTRKTELSEIPWNHWIDPDNWINQSITISETDEDNEGLPGLYKGAYYCPEPFYRATYNSTMNSSAQPFYPVNEEQMVLGFYNYVEGIDDASPSSRNIDMVNGESLSFSVTSLEVVRDGLTERLPVEWFVNGEFVTADFGYIFDSILYSESCHVVEAVVTDLVNNVDTKVRLDPSDLLKTSRTWYLSVGNNVCDTPTARPGGPYIGTAEIPIEFDGASSGDQTGLALSYTWDFGDYSIPDGREGESFTGPNPTHTYQSAGVYLVTLTVKGSQGQHTETTQISIGENTAELTSHTDNSVFTSTEETFTWNSVPGVTGYSLELTNASGWSYFNSVPATTVTVTDLPRDGQLITFKLHTQFEGRGFNKYYTFTAHGLLADPGGPYFGDVAKEIIFDGTGSTDHANQVLTYLWDFGDGATGTGPTPTHLYQQAGKYTGSLTVSRANSDDTFEGSDTAIFEVGVYTVASISNHPDDSILPAGPIIFVWNEALDATTYFIKMGSSERGFDYGIKMLSEEIWTFDELPQDGREVFVMLTTTYPGVQFPDYTSYRIKLIADAGGPYEGDVGQPIVFSGSPEADSPEFTYSYQWEFGDGSTAVGRSPSHAYSSPDSYNATLVVSRIESGEVVAVSDTINFTVVVNTTGGVITSPADGSTFTSSTVTFEWTPIPVEDGDMEPSYGLNFRTSPNGPLLAAHQVGQGGVTSFTKTDLPTNGEPIYVELFIFHANGIKFDKRTYIAASPAPLVADAGGPYKGEVGKSIEFSGSTESDAAEFTYTYAWEFGDDFSGVGQSPSHTYSNPGYYNATLVASRIDDGEIVAISEPINFIVVVIPAGGVIIMPPNGSTFTSSTVTFEWTPILVEEGDMEPSYGLNFRTSPGGPLIGAHQVGQGGVTSFTKTDLPTNGEPIYVELFIFHANGIKVDDNSYTAASIALETLTIDVETTSKWWGLTVDISWSGAESVDIYRDGELSKEGVTANPTRINQYFDSTTYNWKVCLPGTDVCSEEIQ